MRYLSDIAKFPVVATYLGHEVHFAEQFNRFYVYLDNEVVGSINLPALRKKIELSEGKVEVIRMPSHFGNVSIEKVIKFEADGRLRTAGGLYSMYGSSNDFFFRDADLEAQLEDLREEYERVQTSYLDKWEALRSQLKPVTPESLKEKQQNGNSSSE